MHAYRTLLEQKIRERRQTFEEFAEYAETFARDHGEPGTLSLRHLQRLAAGRKSDGRPLGQPLPATTRLLEQIFGVNIDELLAPPAVEEGTEDPTTEIRRRLRISTRVDMATVRMLQDQLTAIRRLDRELGAVVAHDEVRTKVDQVTSLFIHSLTVTVREHLAGLLSELLCLAGWQALDLGYVAEAWRHYSDARSAALEAGAPAHLALAEAGRAFVLLDAHETRPAVNMLAQIRDSLAAKCSPILRSWLAAAHGETMAANCERIHSLHAFDQATRLLPPNSIDPGGPYVALDQIHLARWRGYALAQFAEPEAIDVLSNALDGLDSTFTRAEASLRVDLAVALTVLDELTEAGLQVLRAKQLAIEIGSHRQQIRIQKLTKRGLLAQ